MTVAVPGAKNAQDVERLLVASGQLQSFDLFKFLNQTSTAGRNQAKPYASMYDLLKAAQPQVKDESDVAGWALFDKSTKKQYGQIEATKDQVLQDIAGEAQPADPVWLPVPKGTSVVSCPAANSCPGVTTTEGTFYYLFNLNTDERGNPDVITGDQVGAEASTDPNSGQPIVSLTYKNGGGDEFHNITRNLAIEGRRGGDADAAGDRRRRPAGGDADRRLQPVPRRDRRLDQQLERDHRRLAGRRPSGSRSRCRPARCRSSSAPSRPR